MQEIEFSIFSHGEVGDRQIQDVLRSFERDKNIRVHMDIMPWSGGWAKMVSTALYRDGPDLSEVGSTWLGDLENMEALHIFSPQEVYRTGGKDHFLPSSWKSATASASEFQPELCCAIPWTVDPRVVFYRRDLLQSAGIDESTAFRTSEQFEQTLSRLQAHGVKSPLAIPTLRSRLTIHILASWVWEAGSDFVSKDFSTVRFIEPQALAGFEKYFRLGRYLPAEQNLLNDGDTNELFITSKAAVLISGHWILRASNILPAVRENLGVAHLPGAPFVGGTHLGIWKYTKKQDAALQLIQYLVNNRASMPIYPEIGLPARLDGYSQAIFSNDPIYHSLEEAARSGRSFPAGRLWGLVENRLVDLFPMIWKEVLADNNADIPRILRRYLEPAAQRLAITMLT
jgi:multiple sugar transport system substrate-binding protein